MIVVFVGSGSMGPRFIMGLLKRHGHQCHGIFQGVGQLLGEQPAGGFDPPIKLDDLLALQPDIVGFSACSFDFAKQLEMASLVKLADSNILTVFGGVHPTVLPESTIRHEQVDIICIGEGEYPLLDLCTALEANQDITSIPNLWVKQNGKIYRNPLRDWVQNLDDLPMDREGLSYPGVYTGRGCSGECAFCNTPTIKRTGARGKFFRKRGVDNVLDEIAVIVATDRVFLAQPAPPLYRRAKAFVKRLGKAWLDRDQETPSHRAPDISIRMKDDTFLASKKWFLEFAPAFKQRFPDLTYICQARANEIDEEVAYWLAESNCKMVSLGIECGNEKFRNEVLKKQATTGQIVHVVNLLHQHGISVLGQWIIGLPGETVDLALESLKLHCRLGDIPQVHIATPFPRTELHDIAVKMGFISADFIPNTSLYDDFLFHEGHEKKLMRMIYNIFPVSRLVIPDGFNDISFLGRSKVYKGGKTIGDIIDMNMDT